MMGEFFKKNCRAIESSTWIGAVVALGAASVAAFVTLVKEDKREIKRYQKLDEVYQAQIDMYRSMTDRKES